MLLTKIKETRKQHNVTPSQSHFCDQLEDTVLLYCSLYFLSRVLKPVIIFIRYICKMVLTRFVNVTFKFLDFRFLNFQQNNSLCTDYISPSKEQD